MSDGDRVESNLGELDRNINDTLVFSRTVLDKFVKLKNGFRAVPMNEDSETNKEEALDNKILISNRNVKDIKQNLIDIEILISYFESILE